MSTTARIDEERYYLERRLRRAFQDFNGLAQRWGRPPEAAFYGLSPSAEAKFRRQCAEIARQIHVMREELGL